MLARQSPHTRSDRRRLGSYYTSDDVADHMARQAIVPWLLRQAGWPGDTAKLVTANQDGLAIALRWLESADVGSLRSFRQALRRIRVLDPTCGDGAFLLAALRVLHALTRACHAEAAAPRIVADNLHGVDLCPDAVAACRMALWRACNATPQVNLTVGNVLTSEVPHQGDFDVILGNPPYLELREIDYHPRGYSCLDTGAVHALVVERSLRLLHPQGHLSMIVPLSLVSTQRMRPVQQLLEADRDVWYANFSWRPARLFADVNRALTVFLTTPGTGRTWSTGYLRWHSRDRARLMGRIRYTEVPRPRETFWVPKLSSDLERPLLERWHSLPTRLGHFLDPQGEECRRVYYRCDGGLYWKVFTDFAPAFRLDGTAGASTRQASLALAHPEWVLPAIAALSSDLFWWWYTVSSNCRHLNPADLHGFPLPASVLDDAELAKAGRCYLDDIARHSRMKTRVQKQTGHTQTQSFVIRHSRPLIERLNRLLAPHYGLSAEELHFITNYDLNWRLGRAARA